MTIRLIAFLVAEQEQAVIARLQRCSFAPQKVLRGPDMGYGEHGANAVLSARHICGDHTCSFCGRTDGIVSMDAFLALRSASVGAKPVHTHRSDAATFSSASFHSATLTTSI